MAVVGRRFCGKESVRSSEILSVCAEFSLASPRRFCIFRLRKEKAGVAQW